MPNAMKKSLPKPSWTVLLGFGFVTTLVFVLTGFRTEAAVTFTADTTIDASDLTYESQDIVVQGVTLTVNGSHQFASISLRQKGTLTHSPATTTQVYSVDLTVAGTLLIVAPSWIDVSGRGYPANRTLGNTITNASTGFSGGSYGGFAPSRSGTANSVVNIR